MMTQAATETIEVIRAAEKAAAILSPSRLSLLENLREPDSAAGLARRMGLPRQRINHHLRELEKAGLLELVEERRKGNCIEKILKSRARYYLISPEALGPLSAMEPETMRDRFSWSYLVAVAAKAVRDLATLRRRADRARKKLSTFTLQTEVRFASPQARNAFTEELSNTVARLAAKYHDEKTEEGRRFTFFLGAYPTITKTENDEEQTPGPARKGEKS
jgi:DNA-binding transcriptional ArsR family regulator